MPEPLYAPPARIESHHVVSSFSSGNVRLDAWLREHALGNEGSASRTYVVTHGGNTVVAYYALASGRLGLTELPRKMRRNQPDFVPVILLGRLAVDSDHSGQGLGSFLLREAMIRTIEVSELVGVRGLLVHAIDDEAVQFYGHFGFQPSPSSPYSLIIPIEVIEKSLKDEG
ncbi:MAG: hypothetical protein B7Y45_08030 [Sphingomonas sp. 28-66-16]|nr:MAG: hypothetical protein B7Y45_08030 [Sphingomonas sp. 28-66-16]